MWEDLSVPLSELRADVRSGNGSGFDLETRGESGDWLLRIWGGFAAEWCGNLALNCAGAGVSILDGAAERLARNHWIAFFGLRATNPVARPPALDFLRMALRRPGHRIAAADVSLDEVVVRLARDADALEVVVGGPDRIGLLAFLLGRCARFGLHPARLELQTREGRARDRLLLDGPAKPALVGAASGLERSLRGLCRPV